MAKIRNKLYPNPANAKAFPAGTPVTIAQLIRLGDKKFGTTAIVSPNAFYLTICSSYEKKADKLLKIIHNIVRKSEKDIPYIETDISNNFLAVCIQAIVFGYASMEATANSHISNNSPEDKKARYLKKDLAEKLNIILPKLLKKTSISHQKILWEKFHYFDELRHKIIHPIPSYFKNSDQWDKTIVYELMNAKYRGISKLAKDINNYFKLDPPIGPVTYTVQRGMQSRPL